MAMLLLGLDVGTTCVKAVVADETLAILGESFAEIGIDYPRPGYAEQDAQAVWRTVKQVMCRAVKDNGARIGAISLSVQGDAVIPVNRQGKALGPVQLGMDYRGAQQAEWLARTAGGRAVFQRTGLRPHPLHSLVKILWLRENEPKTFADTWKFMTYSDFLLCQLGAEEPVIDHTMASRTMAMDIHSLRWSEEMLAVCGLSDTLFSRAAPSGTVAGKLGAALAGELDINPDALLVTGGHDQCCAALGAGVWEEGLALDSHGSAEVVSAALSRPKLSDAMYDGYYPCYAHGLPGRYFTFSLNHTAGVLLRWAAENLCAEDVRQAKESGQNVYEAVIRRWGGKPSPLLLLPYFNGSGTPTCDVHAKGMLAGLTLSTTRYDIAGAVLEALCYELRLNITALRQAGVPIHSLRCVGGGARSALGLQVKADVTGLPVYTLKKGEAACIGAAILAGVGARVFKTPRQAADLLALDGVYEPNMERHALYNEKFQLYRELFAVNQRLLHQL